MKTIEHAHVAEAIGRVRETVPLLARRALAEYAENTPRYVESGTPPHLHRDGAQTTRTIMRVTLESVVSPEPAIDHAINEIAPRGAERVAERLPLREYLRCWSTAFDVLSEAVSAEIGDARVALRTVGRMRRTHDLLLRRAADAYLVAASELAAAPSRQDTEILNALFAGSTLPVDDPAVAPGSVVVHLRIGEAPGENSENAETSSLARHRKIHQVRTQLVRELTNLYLIDISGRHGRMLLHSAIPEPDVLAREIATSIGASVTMASEPAENTADLPRASRAAREALDTAVRLGMVDRHVRMEDVALQYQLSHQSVALPYLNERCRAILEDDTLLRTVVSFMDNNLDRRATAEDLFVHPNTVDNRLSRVRTLTGLNIRRTRDLMMIAVVVTAHRPPDSPRTL